MSAPDSGNSEPVHLSEDADTGDRFLVYGTEKGVRVELRYHGEALWMAQAQMADLFGRDVSVISRHIANIFDEGELPQGGDLHLLQIRGPGNRPVTIYSLDMVISVGYRVSSAQATMFRRWATAVLVRFATKGFVVDVERLKAPGARDHVAELREIIRDIRSSEANLYAELRAICSMCQDYDPKADAWRDFYRNTQAKLCYAVTNLTPSQVIEARADASKENMGLMVWAGDDIKSADVTVAKNFLHPGEIKELNRLTDLLLTIFEDQLDVGRLTTMRQAATLFDKQLRDLGRVVLSSGGSISKGTADSHAKTQYQKFNAQRRSAEKARVDAEYTALKAEAETLPKEGRKRGGKRRD